MDAIVGKSYSVGFVFLIEDEYVTPDSGSMTYSVFDNSGSAMTGLSDVAQSNSLIVDNVLKITIASDKHTVASGKSFEQRTVELLFTVSGVRHRFVKHYYVTPRLNYRCEASQVLALLGLKEGEVWADQVDFVKAYIDLKEELGSTILDTALSSGTSSQLAANDAILAKAALDMASALSLKALRKAGGDSISYQRFEKVDFQGIKQDLQAKLNTALEGISGSTTIPEVFSVATPTNAITGA